MGINASLFRGFVVKGFRLNHGWLCFHLFVSLQSISDFVLEGRAEDGRGKCAFDPSHSVTTVMVGE